MNQSIKLKIVRVPIGGGFYNCSKKCSFFKDYVIGKGSCIIYGELNKHIKYKQPLSKCSNLITNVKRDNERKHKSPIYLPGNTIVDIFGRRWKLSESEVCPRCGQPDNTGDCNHKKISKKQVTLIQKGN